MKAPGFLAGANGRVTRNTAAGAAANVAKIGLQILLLPVLARLLGPAEFGLYTLALPTIWIFVTLADGGLGVSLAREPEDSVLVWSSAFWMLLASCTAMAAAVIGAGYGLAAVSGQPRLFGIMALLSTSVVLLGLTICPDARLVRRGNLMVHAGADFAATLLGAVVAVVMARSGAGAWSLAGQYVGTFAMRAAVLNAAAFSVPTLQFDFAALRPHLLVGGALVGGRLIELGGRLAENLLFNHWFGPGGLGAYTFAGQTSRYVCDAASNPVAGALYAHALREDAPSVSAALAGLSRLLASILLPGALLVAVSAPQLLDLMLGPKWAASAPLLQVMLPFAALAAVSSLCAPVLNAQGRTGSTFMAVALAAAGRVAAVALGFWTGPLGVAWGVGLCSLLFAIVIVAALATADPTRASVRTLVRPVAPPLLAAAAGSTACASMLSGSAATAAGTALALAVGSAIVLASLAALGGLRSIHSLGRSD